jgi:hypothetical protein
MAYVRDADMFRNHAGARLLSRIMHGAACFWTLVDEAHAFNPTGWIGESNSRCDALLVDLW